MTEREQFEAWFSSSGKYPKAIERVGDDYKLSTAYAAWNAWQPAWQASRRAALEESWEAVHAERLTDPTDSADDIAYNVAVQDCENAIRALAASDSDGGKDE